MPRCGNRPAHGDQNRRRVFTRIYGIGVFWGLICFGIGIEQGLGNLERERAMHYVIALSEFPSAFIAGYLGGLSERGILSPDKVGVQSIFIAKTVLQTGIQIQELGRKECKSTERNNSDFLKALLRLKIS